MSDRLTHEESQGTIKDILERFSSSRGKLWHQAIKRFLLGTSPDFYMVEIGDSGNIRNLLEKFSHAGFSVSPFGGEVEQGLRASNPRQIYRNWECFCMMPVRAMDFQRTRFVQHETQASVIQHIGHVDGCVTTSWEAGCKLLLETQWEEGRIHNMRRTLLQISPSPVVWTFVGGNHESRLSLATNPASDQPRLVCLVSEDAKLGFKGMAEAGYMYQLLGREDGVILPSDIFIFSINTGQN